MKSFFDRQLAEIEGLAPAVAAFCLLVWGIQTWFPQPPYVYGIGAGVAALTFLCLRVSRDLGRMRNGN